MPVESIHSCVLEDLGNDTRADRLATLTEREPTMGVSRTPRQRQ